MAMAMAWVPKPNMNYERAQQRIRDLNGGELPSELYTMTNAELSDMIYDLSGKLPAPRTSKVTLVKRLERLQQKNVVPAVKTTVAGKSVTKKPSKRGCLPVVSTKQAAEMRRMLICDADTMASRHTGKELYAMWHKMGVTSLYPPRDSKKNIIDKMKKFATRNFEYHGLE